MKRLSAYKTVDKQNYLQDMVPILVVTGEIGSYFLSEGYTSHSSGSLLPIECEYRGANDQRIKLVCRPDFRSQGADRLIHEWEFGCPDAEADLHIKQLEQLYGEFNFEIENSPRAFP